MGCILAELLTGKPILAGKNEMEQVNLIFKLCGALPCTLPFASAW